MAEAGSTEAVRGRRAAVAERLTARNEEQDKDEVVEEVRRAAGRRRAAEEVMMNRSSLRGRTRARQGQKGDLGYAEKLSAAFSPAKDMRNRGKLRLAGFGAVGAISTKPGRVLRQSVQLLQ